jgi:hypothetical protein
MRKGYKPDGWLGFMVGSRMHIDFGRFDFEIACKKLMTEINLQSKGPLPSIHDRMAEHENSGEILPYKQQQQLSRSRRKKPLVFHHNNVFSIYTKRKPMSNFFRKYLNQWTESDVLDFLFTERLIPLMPLCEKMNGRALVQLYKMSISRSSRTYILLNDELKSTYKMKLPIGIYTRFLGAMEQRLNTPPGTSPGTILKIPQTTSTTIPQQYVPYPSRTLAVNPYPIHSDKPYDAIVISNAPALQVLRAVERYGLDFAKMLPT